MSAPDATPTAHRVRIAKAAVVASLEPSSANDSSPADAQETKTAQWTAPVPPSAERICNSGNRRANAPTPPAARSNSPAGSHHAQSGVVGAGRLRRLPQKRSDRRAAGSQIAERHHTRRRGTVPPGALALAEGQGLPTARAPRRARQGRRPLRALPLPVRRTNRRRAVRPARAPCSMRRCRRRARATENSRRRPDRPIRLHVMTARPPRRKARQAPARASLHCAQRRRAFRCAFGDADARCPAPAVFAAQPYGDLRSDAFTGSPCGPQRCDRAERAGGSARLVELRG